MAVAGRFLTGLVVGVTNAAAVTYVGEVAFCDVRGAMCE
jgi:hypothetical protein